MTDDVPTLLEELRDWSDGAFPTFLVQHKLYREQHVGYRAAATIERLTRERDMLRASLERVLNYWRERYHQDFALADEVLIGEIRRVEDVLSRLASAVHTGELP